MRAEVPRGLNNLQTVEAHFQGGGFLAVRLFIQLPGLLYATISFRTVADHTPFVRYPTETDIRRVSRTLHKVALSSFPFESPAFRHPAVVTRNDRQHLTNHITTVFLS